MDEEYIKNMEESINKKIDVLRQENNDGMQQIRKEIADHNAKHEGDMEELKPIIKAWKTSENTLDAAKSTGWVMTKIAGFIVAMGTAWLMVLQVLHR